MNNVFYFLDRDALTSGAFLTLGGVVHNPITFLIRLSYTGPPVVIDPGPSTRHLWTAPKPQRPLKLIKLANPKPAYPASPISPCANHNKDSCPHVPPLPLCLDRTQGFFVHLPMVWHAWPLPLVPANVPNHLFNGHCFFICQPY